MSICDICGVDIKNDSKIFSSEDLKKAVKAGFRPPPSVFDDMAVQAYGKEAEKFMEAGWIKQVMEDTSNWMLCSKCTSELEKLLKKKVSV
jgi:hypothetical protein